jgi:hypothetical protein
VSISHDVCGSLVKVLIVSLPFVLTLHLCHVVGVQGASVAYTEVWLLFCVFSLPSDQTLFFGLLFPTSPQDCGLYVWLECVCVETFTKILCCIFLLATLLQGVFVK